MSVETPCELHGPHLKSCVECSAPVVAADILVRTADGRSFRRVRVQADRATDRDVVTADGHGDGRALLHVGRCARDHRLLLLPLDDQSCTEQLLRGCGHGHRVHVCAVVPAAWSAELATASSSPSARPSATGEVGRC